MNTLDILSEVGELSTIAEEEYTEAIQGNAVEIAKAWKTMHTRLAKLYEELDRYNEYYGKEV